MRVCRYRRQLHDVAIDGQAVLIAIVDPPGRCRSPPFAISHQAVGACASVSVTDVGHVLVVADQSLCKRAKQTLQHCSTDPSRALVCVSRPAEWNMPGACDTLVTWHGVWFDGRRDHA